MLPAELGLVPHRVIRGSHGANRKSNSSLHCHTAPGAGLANSGAGHLAPADKAAPSDHTTFSDEWLGLLQSVPLNDFSSRACACSTATSERTFCIITTPANVIACR